MSMLRNDRVLDAETVPERDLLVHRRQELETLLNALRPTWSSTANDIVYLLGPTGVGKTTLASLAIDELDSTSKTCYVNCWDHYTRGDVLHHLASTLVDPTISRQTSIGQFASALQQAPDRHRCVVIDEVDQLADTSVLYDLYRAPDLSVALVANSVEELLASVDDRVQSRIQVGRRIELDRYSVSELVEILQVRAEHAFLPRQEVVTDRQLEAIAGHADGDARVAISILRVAVEHCRSDGRQSVSNSDIESAVPEAREQLRDSVLEKLNEHQRELYEIVREMEPISPGDLYDQCQERIDEPHGRRTLQKYVAKLEQYRLVDSTGQGPAKVVHL